MPPDASESGPPQARLVVESGHSLAQKRSHTRLYIEGDPFRTGSVGTGGLMAETILLVDDDASVRELAARVLERRGFRVLLAADGVQALALSSGEESVHLLLTDVVMPRLGGVELAKRLRELRPAT